MTFKQRLPYFLGGLILGVIAVVFFLGKKNTSFDYLPNARVLKNIRIKNRVLSDEVQTALNLTKTDTAVISQILKNGNVDLFNKIRMDSCIQYDIKGKKEQKNIMLTIKNCDNTAFIEKIRIE